ncbi:hypothetical protein [Marinimicrobium locisalis]|uniref:hypothetical protein n=1 Tax=Marinimicrobium locisalis TaxID=546022 RepID=UPI0032217374
MGESQKSHRVQIVVALIGVLGTIIAAFVSNTDWDSGPPEPTDPTESQDSLAGFYVRDGLANSPVMKIEPIGGNEYKLEVFNHPWPWEATVRLSGSELSGFGRFPESKATMDFKGQVSGDGSIRSEYHFITKGDGSPAGGRVDTHIWTPRED